MVTDNNAHGCVHVCTVGCGGPGEGGSIEKRTTWSLRPSSLLAAARSCGRDALLAQKLRVSTHYFRLTNTTRLDMKVVASIISGSGTGPADLAIGRLIFSWLYC